MPSFPSPGKRQVAFHCNPQHLLTSSPPASSLLQKDDMKDERFCPRKSASPSSLLSCLSGFSFFSSIRSLLTCYANTDYCNHLTLQLSNSLFLQLPLSSYGWLVFHVLLRLRKQCKEIRTTSRRPGRTTSERLEEKTDCSPDAGDQLSLSHSHVPEDFCCAYSVVLLTTHARRGAERHDMRGDQRFSEMRGRIRDACMTGLRAERCNPSSAGDEEQRDSRTRAYMLCLTA